MLHQVSAEGTIVGSSDISQGCHQRLVHLPFQCREDVMRRLRRSPHRTVGLPGSEIRPTLAQGVPEISDLLWLEWWRSSPLLKKSHSIIASLSSQHEAHAELHSDIPASLSSHNRSRLALDIRYTIALEARVDTTITLLSSVVFHLVSMLCAFGSNTAGYLCTLCHIPPKCASLESLHAFLPSFPPH